MPLLCTGAARSWRPSVAPRAPLLRSRFGWFFIGRAVDRAGSSITNAALPLAVLGASSRASDLGVVLAANMAPTLVLLLVGGAVADRFDRRTLLIGLNLVSAASAAAMGGLLLAGRFQLATFVVLALINGAVSAFTSPALRGIVPELVTAADLQRANALLSSAQNGVRIIAPTLAGILVTTVGGGWALLIDASTFLVCAVVFLRIPGGRRPSAGRQPLWRDLAQGWRAYLSMGWVVIMTVTFAALNAFNVGPWNVLGPTIVSERSGPVGWTTVLTFRAVGLLMMSVVSIKIIWKYPLRTGLLAGSLSSLPLLCLGLSGAWWVVGIAAFFGGLGFALCGVTWETAFQQQVPRAALSRVSAYDDLLSFLAIPLSPLAVGPLAAAFGAPRIAVFCGLGYLACALLPLASRQVRGLTTVEARP